MRAGPIIAPSPPSWSSTCVPKGNTATRPASRSSTRKPARRKPPWPVPGTPVTITAMQTAHHVCPRRLDKTKGCHYHWLPARKPSVLGRRNIKLLRPEWRSSHRSHRQQETSLPRCANDLRPVAKKKSHQESKAAVQEQMWVTPLPQESVVDGQTGLYMLGE